MTKGQRLVIGLVVLATSSGCTGGTVKRQDEPKPNPDAAGRDGSFAEDSASLLLPDVAIAEPLPLAGCTRDLRGTVDPAGNRIATCAPDQGCLDGRCVPACQAVAATHGSVGCDFLIPRPPLAGYPTSCFAVFVANNWTQPATVKVTQGARSYDVSQFGRVAMDGKPETSWASIPGGGLPTGQVAVLFLEGGPTQGRGCPVGVAVETSTTIAQTGRGHAWHIVTDTPVSVYDIAPYGGADSMIPSAELVFPTTTWSDNYVAVVPMFRSTKRVVSVPASQWAQIVAAEDNTEVKVVPRAALPSGAGVVGAPEKAVTTYTLSAGEVIQWNREDGSAMEMTGSIISSNRPVGFVGGNEFLCIDSVTSSNGGCDSAHQQIPPVSALGNRYAVAPHPTRRADGQPESIWYRMVGTVDGTVLSYDPPTAGAPTTLAQGQWSDFQAVGGFQVASQDGEHPFYLAQTMSGSGVLGAKPGNLGDEEFVNVVPPAQFFSSYVFYTDQTYTTTALVLSQCDEGHGFDDVSIQCLGPVTGWSAIGSSGQCRWTTVNLVQDGKGVGTCKNGPQLASSGAPFGLTVWGLAASASYAYPAGAGVTPINKVVIPPFPIP